MRIDVNRLAVLERISAREAAAVERVRVAMDADISAATALRRKFAAQQRRNGFVGGLTADDQDAGEYRKQAAEINRRIVDNEAAIEELQERAVAAKRLRRSCQAWAAQNAELGGGQ